MTWMTSVQEMEALCEEVERALDACGYTSALAIVRSKFAQTHKFVWVDDVSKFKTSDIRILDWCGMVVVDDSVRVGVR